MQSTVLWSIINAWKVFSLPSGLWTEPLIIILFFLIQVLNLLNTKTVLLSF